jgi:hypothetical protein
VVITVVSIETGVVDAICDGGEAHNELLVKKLLHEYKGESQDKEEVAPSRDERTLGH